MKYKEKSTGEFALHVYWNLTYFMRKCCKIYRIYLPTMHHDILLPN